MIEISDEIKIAYQQIKKDEDSFYIYDSKDHPEFMVVDAFRDVLAKAMKAEAFLNWIIGGKEGPSPSMFDDTWKKEADKLLSE